MEYIGGVIWDNGYEVLGNPIWAVFVEDNAVYCMPAVPNYEELKEIGYVQYYPDENVDLLDFANRFNIRIDETLDLKTLLKCSLNYMDNQELERLELSDMFKITRQKYSNKIQELC